MTDYKQKYIEVLEASQHELDKAARLFMAIKKLTDDARIEGVADSGSFGCDMAKDLFDCELEDIQKGTKHNIDLSQHKPKNNEQQNAKQMELRNKVYHYITQSQWSINRLLADNKLTNTDIETITSMLCILDSHIEGIRSAYENLESDGEVWA